MDYLFMVPFAGVLAQPRIWHKLVGEWSNTPQNFPVAIPF